MLKKSGGGMGRGPILFNGEDCPLSSPWEGWGGSWPVRLSALLVFQPPPSGPQTSLNKSSSP